MSTSTINAFLARATGSPYALSLGVGLCGVSYFLWGNIAMHYSGAMVFAVDPEERRKMGIETSKAVEIFAWAYVRGGKHFGVSGVVSGLAVLTAAFNAPSTQSAAIRNHLFLLSPLLFSLMAWTLVVMLPTNNALLAIRDRIVKARSSTEEGPLLTTSQEEEADALLYKWKQMHFVRVAISALAWVGTLAAYTMSV